MEDLNAYEAVWRKPLRARWRDYEIISSPLFKIGAAVPEGARDSTPLGAELSGSNQTFLLRQVPLVPFSKTCFPLKHDNPITARGRPPSGPLPIKRERSVSTSSMCHICMEKLMEIILQGPSPTLCQEILPEPEPKNATNADTA